LSSSSSFTNIGTLLHRFSLSRMILPVLIRRAGRLEAVVDILVEETARGLALA
jgi:hypothetical protein